MMQEVFVGHYVFLHMVDKLERHVHVRASPQYWRLRTHGEVKTTLKLRHQQTPQMAKLQSNSTDATTRWAAVNTARQNHAAAWLSTSPFDHFVRRCWASSSTSLGQGGLRSKSALWQKHVEEVAGAKRECRLAMATLGTLEKYSRNRVLFSRREMRAPTPKLRWTVRCSAECHAPCTTTGTSTCQPPCAIVRGARRSHSAHEMSAMTPCTVGRMDKGGAGGPLRNAW